MKYPRKVYAIRHNATNKVYVGSSCNVDRRFLQHLYALRSHNHPVDDMQKDFDEQGEDYTMTVLDTIKDKNEDCKEYKWMKRYESFVRGTGYNYKDRKFCGEGNTNDEEPNSRKALTENEREFIEQMRFIKEKDPYAYSILQVLAVMLAHGSGKEGS